MTTEATLSPEALKELDKQRSSFKAHLEEVLHFQTNFAGGIADVALRYFRTAATVAVEGMEAELEKERVRGNTWNVKAKDLQELLEEQKTELATLRNHAGRFEKTTEEEANTIIMAWRTSSGAFDYSTTQTAVDAIIAKRLPRPLAGGGMGIEERCEKLFFDMSLGAYITDEKQKGACVYLMSKSMQQAVAEAESGQRIKCEQCRINQEQRHAKELQEAKDEAWKLCREGEEEYWRSQLAIKLDEASERHAKELQEAVAAERMNSDERSAKEDGYWHEAVQAQKERHAAELAKVTAEGNEWSRRCLDANAKLADVRDELAQERANWQAQHDRALTVMKSLCDDISGCPAAYHSQVELLRHQTTAYRIIRERKPQEPEKPPRPFTLEVTL